LIKKEIYFIVISSVEVFSIWISKKLIDELIRWIIQGNKEIVF